jgi:hypothetical protein
MHIAEQERRAAPAFFKSTALASKAAQKFSKTKNRRVTLDARPLMKRRTLNVVARPLASHRFLTQIGTGWPAPPRCGSCRLRRVERHPKKRLYLSQGGRILRRSGRD